MIHRGLRLARAITKSRPTGTPRDWRPGIVVSSTIGQSVVTLDGGRTEVSAFNHDHTKSLAPGTIVHVEVVGNKLWVQGANPS